MELDLEQTNLLIKLKQDLRLGGYEKEEQEIDRMLCQYDGANVITKRQFLNRLICLCRVKAYGELYIPNLAYGKWISFLSEVNEAFRGLLSQMETQIEKLPLSNISYNGKTYDVLSDAVTWIQSEKVLVFLLKDHGQYFEDNIVASDYEGNCLWSSKDTIDIKDRDGAVFVSLKQSGRGTLYVAAWVGITYEMDVGTGANKPIRTDRPCKCRAFRV